MANNDCFYSGARVALDEENDIRELVRDLDAAVESYLTGCDENGDLSLNEIVNGHEAAVEFANNLLAWRRAAEREGLSGH